MQPPTSHHRVLRAATREDSSTPSSNSPDKPDQQRNCPPNTQLCPPTTVWPTRNCPPRTSAPPGDVSAPTSTRRCRSGDPTATTFPGRGRRQKP